MKKIMFGLAAMASLTLTACGGSVCDDAKDSASHLKSVYDELRHRRLRRRADGRGRRGL